MREIMNNQHATLVRYLEHVVDMEERVVVVG